MTRLRLISALLPALGCLLMGGWGAEGAEGAGEPARTGILQMRQGYFWDPVRQAYFIPRGISYQTWNLPVGANQSLEQLDYDLLEFKKIHANSVRCELTWGGLQLSETTYDWTRADHLVRRAEELGLRLFILIGYQYPPAWFPSAYRGVNDEYTDSNDPTQVIPKALSDVLNYEHPEARRIYAQHISAVTGRYKDSTAIGGWILGNEYAYFDLWEDPNIYVVHRFIGFDPISQSSFREYLRTKYGGDLGALNANWQSGFPNFDAVVMPRRYPPNRKFPGYHDLIQWRKKSIGDFVAEGAAAARRADTNHLISYSMVGGIFNGRDANYACEDGATIVARCAAAGAPLNFWSVNNYAWASVGNEMRSADFGIAKYQAQTGLPVFISETGCSDTEDLPGFDGAPARQARVLPSTLWESLTSGAIGISFFHWNDRSQYTQGYFPRERGFGVVREVRTPKIRVYSNILTMFRQMENIGLDRLLGGSSNPPPDIQLLWSRESDMVWPRANQENAMIWGALRRLGYQPAILDDRGFDAGGWSNAPALLLSRCWQLQPRHLEALETNVLAHGIAIHAQADLPGQYDAYNRPNAGWSDWMKRVFGVDVSGATTAFDGAVINDNYTTLNLKGTVALDPITPATREQFVTWKIWHGVAPVTAQVVMTDSGLGGTRPNTPALLVRPPEAGKGPSALNTFALGDTYASGGDPAGSWSRRSDFLKAIYRTHFGITPVIELTGSNAVHVMSDYRLCRNGSVLVSLLNEHTNHARVLLNAPTLLKGRKVENLTTGDILTENSTGTLELSLTDDDFQLLYAYPGDGATDQSLIQPSPNKIWFDDAPLAVWPSGQAVQLVLGANVPEPGLSLVARFVQTRPVRRTLAEAAPIPLPLTGRQSAPVSLTLPDADAADSDYLSDRRGGAYAFRAELQKAGRTVSEAELPVRVAFGVRPTGPLPAPVLPGTSYRVEFEWEELPSYLPGDPTPLDRARLWQSAEATLQRYEVVVELLDRGRPVASARHLTRKGTDRSLFTIAAPANATGPFAWTARLETAPNVASHDVEESFEGLERGARWPDHLDQNFIGTWATLKYTSPATVDIWQNEGVHLEASDGSESAFLVVTNLPDQAFSGMGLYYSFPAAWSLPPDRRLWNAIRFGFDFKEAAGLPAVLELQVKSSNGRWISFTQPYDPRVSLWNRIEASLDQFGPGQDPGFDPGDVVQLAAIVQMGSVPAQYVGSFDNLRFTGPETNPGGGVPMMPYTNANDHAGELRVVGDRGGMVVYWTGPGVLQTAAEVEGPWTDLTAARSPHQVPPIQQAAFYRLRSP